MKYKITKHIPDFCDVDKGENLFIENLEDIYNLEFVKRIRDLRDFDKFVLSEDETLLIVYFKNNTYYVIAHIVELANPNKGVIF